MFSLTCSSCLLSTLPFQLWWFFWFFKILYDYIKSTLEWQCISDNLTSADSEIRYFMSYTVQKETISQEVSEVSQVFSNLCITKWVSLRSITSHVLLWPQGCKTRDRELSWVTAGLGNIWKSSQLLNETPWGETSLHPHFLVFALACVWFCPLSLSLLSPVCTTDSQWDEIIAGKVAEELTGPSQLDSSPLTLSPADTTVGRGQ